MTCSPLKQFQGRRAAGSSNRLSKSFWPNLKIDVVWKPSDNGHPEQYPNLIGSDEIQLLEIFPWMRFLKNHPLDNLTMWSLRHNLMPIFLLPPAQSIMTLLWLVDSAQGPSHLKCVCREFHPSSVLNQLSWSARINQEHPLWPCSLQRVRLKMKGCMSRAWSCGGLINCRERFCHRSKLSNLKDDAFSDPSRVSERSERRARGESGSRTEATNQT